MAIRRPARSVERPKSKANRSTQPANADAAPTTAEAPDIVTKSLEVAPTYQSSSIDSALVGASLPDGSTPVIAPLLETVSSDALTAGQSVTEIHSGIAETLAEDGASEVHAPAAVNVSNAAQDDARGHAGDGEARTEHEAELASLLPAEIESAIASAKDLAAQSPTIEAPSALKEITAANDTLATYVRNESIATLAHWRALSAAKNPADALRLQVNEMQRAADASLSCIASLARRAGRIADTLRRSGHPSR